MADNIERTLQQMGIDRKIVRMNDDNPKCPGCGRREENESLIYQFPIFPSKVCAECADEFENPVTNASELGEVDLLHAPALGSWLSLRYAAIRKRG